MAGYLGVQPVPQSTQHRETFTATASQTSFATAGYTVGFLDVFLNGVKLVNGDDFTATNGSDVLLTTGAASGDIIEVISYSTYEVNSQTYTGGLTVNNDGATVLTVDRATSDGAIIDIQKDGTTVGSIGTSSTGLTIGDGAAGVLFLDSYRILPWNVGTNAGNDANIDLGDSTRRFRTLYLSGGVFIGGTGAANYLDDYEEGTWTGTISDAASGGNTGGTATCYYTKIGRQVFVQGTITVNVTGMTSGNNLHVQGLPFTSNANNDVRWGDVYLRGADYTSGNIPLAVCAGSRTYIYFIEAQAGSFTFNPIEVSEFSNGDVVNFQGHYFT